MNKDFEIKNGILMKYNGVDKEVIIPDGIRSIDDCAFYNCSTLTSVIIPDSVTIIRSEAFQSCKNLISVKFSKNIAIIEEFAFDSCISLLSVILPESIINIEDFAFCNCSSLTSVKFPENIRNIGSCSFRYCKNLTSAVIPDAVETVGKRAFSHHTQVYYHGIRCIPDESGEFHINSIIWDVFCNRPDEEVITIIRKKFHILFRYLIDHENIEIIQKVLDSEKFITDKNIDEWIQYAIDAQKHHSQLMLINYKNQKNWYQNIDEINHKFKL